jgi:hypothetical protein
MQAALTLNAMGECLFKLGRLEEARDLFLQAVPIREKEQGFDSSDARYSRENLALTYEHMGQYDECRRLRNGGKNRFCGNLECKKIHYPKVSACGQCKSIFYCDRSCQVQDWSRHKGFCPHMKH